MATENDNAITTDGFDEDAYNVDADETTSENAGEEWTPPTREEYEALQALADKNYKESIRRKKMLKENGIDLATGKRVESPEDDGDKVSKADHEAVIGQLKNRTTSLLFEVPATLSEAGWNGNRRLLRHLDLDAVTIDEDGVTGLSEQIEELKTEFPEFFKRTRTPAPPADAAGLGPKKSESSGSSHWADVARKQIFGSGN